MFIPENDYCTLNESEYRQFGHGHFCYLATSGNETTLYIRTETDTLLLSTVIITAVCIIPAVVDTVI
jgi:hypothetical protein